MYYIHCIYELDSFFSHQAPRFWGSVSHSGQSLDQAAHITVPGLTSGGSSQSKAKHISFLWNTRACLYCKCEWSHYLSSRAGLVTVLQQSWTSWPRARLSRECRDSLTRSLSPTCSSRCSPPPIKRYVTTRFDHGCYEEVVCCVWWMRWLWLCLNQACVLQRQRKGSVSSDASASTDSNTYYEDDFSSTEEDSSQGNEHWRFLVILRVKKPPIEHCLFTLWNSGIVEGGKKGDNKK